MSEDGAEGMEEQYEDVQYEDTPEHVDLEEVVEKTELETGATLVEK